MFLSGKQGQFAFQAEARVDLCGCCSSWWGEEQEHPMAVLEMFTRALTRIHHCFSQHHMPRFPFPALITHAAGWSQEAARARAERGQFWLPWSEYSRYFPGNDGTGAATDGIPAGTAHTAVAAGFGGMADVSSSLCKILLGFSRCGDS